MSSQYELILKVYLTYFIDFVKENNRKINKRLSTYCLKDKIYQVKRIINAFIKS